MVAFKISDGDHAALPKAWRRQTVTDNISDGDQHWPGLCEGSKATGKISDGDPSALPGALRKARATDNEAAWNG